MRLQVRGGRTHSHLGHELLLLNGAGAGAGVGACCYLVRVAGNAVRDEVRMYWAYMVLRCCGRVLLTDVLHSHDSELPSAWAVVRHTFALGKVYPGSA